MGCCGRRTKRNKPPAVDKRGNSLRNVGFLHPHQKKILEAEDQKKAEEEENKE